LTKILVFYCMASTYEEHIQVLKLCAVNNVLIQHISCIPNFYNYCKLNFVPLTVCSMAIHNLVFRVVFWDILPCKIIVADVLQYAPLKCRSTIILHGSIGYPRRQLWTSYSPPWELEISHNSESIHHMYSTVILNFT
jgi:hypothetical protein